MENAKATINFITKNLQIDVTKIQLISLKQYNKWIFELFFCDWWPLFCKAYIVVMVVKFVVFLIGVLLLLYFEQITFVD